MSKNMTRKGLAFGAGLALVTSGLVGLPAQANGTVNGSVTLLPSAGTTYGALSIGHFDLVGDFTSAVAGNGDLKFLVNAPAGTIDFDATATWDFGTVSIAVASTLVTVTTANNHGLVTGDVVAVSGLTGTGGTTGDPNTTGASITVVNSKVFTYATTGDRTGASGTPALSVTAYGGLSAAKTIRTAALGATSIVAAAEAVDLIDTVTTDEFFVVDMGRNGTIPNYTLRLVAADATVNSTVTVTAWLDDDNDNVIDSAEYASVARTVTFTKDAVATATLTPFVLGADALEAKVTVDRDVNPRMIDDYISVLFDKAGTAIPMHAGITDDVTGANYNLSNVRWDATEAALLATYTPDGDSSDATITDYNATAGTFGVRSYFWDGDGVTAADYATVAGLRSTFTLGGAVADVVQISATQVAGKVISTKTTHEQSTTVNAADYAASTAIGVATVLEETTSVTVNVFVGDDTIASPGQASVPVALIAAATGSGSTGITTADAVTINGVSFPGSSAKTFLANTNSSGIASFVITNVNGTATDKIKFTYNVQGVTGTTNTDSFEVLWAAPSYSAIDADDTAGNGVRSITAGATFTMNYTVSDQWGAAPKNNTQRVVGQAINSAARTKAAVITASAPVVDGKATLTVTDNGTGTGQFQFVVDAVGNNTASSSPYDVTTTVNVVANATAATITPAALVRADYGTAQYNDINNDGDTLDTDEVDNRTRLVLSAKAFADYDGRIAQITLAPEAETTRAVTLRGTVTNSAAAAVAGTPVTLAAKGFQFKAGSVWKKDSITVITSSTGTYSVQVWSQVGGEQTITITSGAATTTQKLTYAAGTATAAAFTVTAPANSQPGRTVDVTVDVDDKFGNPAQGVALTLKSTGPGYLINTSGTTDRTGVYQTKLLVGSNDTGVAVITVTMTIAGVETSKSVTVNIGSGAVSGTGKVNVGSFNGKLVVYASGLNGARISWKVGGVWGSAVATSNYAIFNRPTPRAGVTVSVDVYVNGVKTLTKSVVTR